MPLWATLQQKTFEFKMQLEKKNIEITILRDGGSTHIFIQDRVVKFLGLRVSQSSKFQVMSGNEEKLSCIDSCSQVPVTLGNSSF